MIAMHVAQIASAPCSTSRCQRPARGGRSSVERSESGAAMAPTRPAPGKLEDSGVAGTREQTEAALRIQDDASSSGPNEISVSLEGVDIAPADEALADGRSDAADSAAPASSRWCSCY